MGGGERSLMRILVTGGAGFIGSHLVDLVTSRGHEVTVLDNLDPQVHGPAPTEPRHLAERIHSGEVRFLRGDVTSRDDIEKAIDGVEAVVHLAAVVGVGQSMYEPRYYVHNNSAGTGALLDVIVKRKERIRTMVVASSMSLYGEGAYRCPACGGDRKRARTPDRLEAGLWEVECATCGAALEPAPTAETKAPEIASVYAATKKHQEDLFVSIGAAYGITTFALRLFNVYGARQSLGNPYTGVAAIFLSRLLNGRPPLVFEDGLQSRDFVDVRDVVRALLLCLEFGGGGVHVLNVGTGRPTTVAEIAGTLARALDVSIEPQLLGRYRAGDIRHCIADPSRAGEVLGFRARYSLEAGLPDLIEWCRGESPTDGVDISLDELRKRGLVV
jgi:dTDP-L-rhamnose 4-epimerase